MKKTLICLTFLSLMACYQEPLSKNDFEPVDYTKLPEATEDGENIFGCKVDGKVWVPRIELLFPWTGPRTDYYENGDTGTIYIYRPLLTLNESETLDFRFSFLKSTADTVEGMRVSPVCVQFSKGDGQPLVNMPVDSLSNWIELTRVDTFRRIVSGRFNFKLQNQDQVDQVIDLTDGRFDVRYWRE